MKFYKNIFTVVKCTAFAKATTKCEPLNKICRMEHGIEWNMQRRTKGETHRKRKLKRAE